MPGRWSDGLTLVCFVLTGAAIGALWVSTLASPYTPNFRLSSTVAGELLDAASALDDEPALVRTIAKYHFGNSEVARQRVIDALLHAVERLPPKRAHSAEARRLRNTLAVALASSVDPPVTTLAKVLSDLDERSRCAIGVAFPERVRSTTPSTGKCESTAEFGSPWANDSIEIARALRDSDTELASQRLDALKGRGSRSLRRLVWNDVLLILVGLSCLVSLPFLRLLEAHGRATPEPPTSNHQQWAFQSGIALFARAICLLVFFPLLALEGVTLLFGYASPMADPIALLSTLMVITVTLRLRNRIANKSISSEFGRNQVSVTHAALYVVASVGLMVLGRIAVGLYLTEDLSRYPAMVSMNQASFSLRLDALVAGPICEELIFRLILYRTLRTRISVLPAVGISSIAFSLFHVGVLEALPAAVWMGVVLALTYERSKSFGTIVVCHSVYNFVNLSFWMTLI